MPLNTKIQIRRGSSSEWDIVNPVLASGEPGYDITNQKLKIGDGTTTWNNLAYEGTISPSFSGTVLVNSIPVSVSGHYHQIQDILLLENTLDNKLDNNDVIEGGFF